MSSPDNSSKAKRFEVYMPQNADNVFRELAFTAMLHAFGWEYRDITPDDSIVEPKDILEASEHLFGNEIAGKLANDVLLHYARAAEGGVYGTRTASPGYRHEDPYVVVFQGASLRSIGINSYPSSRNLAQDIHTALAKGGDGWRPNYLPFDVSVSDVMGSANTHYGYKMRRITPNAPSRDRLKGFVDFRKRQTERPPVGIVAKMIRVMSAAAGNEIEPPTADKSTEFMPVETLLELGKEAGLTVSMLKTLAQNIQIAFNDDVLSSRNFFFSSYGLKQNEIVFGGESRIGKVDAIAVDSIPKLVKTYGGNTPTINFLKSFDTNANAVSL